MFSKFVVELEIFVQISTILLKNTFNKGIAMFQGGV